MLDAAGDRTSSQLAAMLWAVLLMACKLEPHKRLTVVPPVSSGSPAISPASAGDVEALFVLAA